MNINEIKSKEFDAVRRGYDPESVKNYLADVANYVQTLETDKVNMMKKLEVLARKVEEYKKDEESLQDALLGAQKLAKQTINEAQEKADNLVKEAEEKAEKMTSSAKMDSEKMLSEAKTFSQELLTKTKAESERMMADTKTNIDNTIRTSRYEIEKEQTILLRTQREVSKFKKELLDIYRSHIDLIQKLPDDQPDKAEEEKEVRELQKNIYQQKVEEQKINDLPEDVTVTAETIDSATVDEIVSEKEETEQTNQAEAVVAPVEEKKDSEQYVSKFGDLKFGSDS